MNLADITTKCYILALIIRDDGERLLLGDGAYEFKDSQQHFIANTYANDVVELQGTDGQMLAGQVRRTATQTFAGYIGDATFSKQAVESARRDFLMFFRKKHYYTAVYVFSDGTAIQRDRGYIVNAPSVPELYQRFPEWSVGLNFEDPNYYEYAEDDLGHEIAAHKVELELSTAMSGGLIWDGDGAVSDDLSYVGTEIEGEGKNFQLADTGTATLKSAELLGDAEQTTYSGKNLLPVLNPYSNTGIKSYNISLPAGTYTLSFAGATTTGSGRASYFRVYDDNNTDLATKTVDFSIPNKWTFTTTAPATKFAIYSQNTYAGSSGVTTTFTNIMLESGNQQTAYEPYVGGTASPNPDYPQPISVVTGEQTVKIEGKNLIGAGSEHYPTAAWYNLNEGATITTTTSGATVAETSNGLNITLTAAWYGVFFIVPVTAGQTYHIKINASGTGCRSSLYWLDADKKILRKGGILNTNPLSLEANLAVNSGEAYIALALGSNTATTIAVTEPQLELGSTATAYEPYQGQEFEVNLGSIELAKIGTYQDRIYKTDGKWYIEKQVGKVAININGYNSSYTNVDYAIFDKPTDALNYDTYSVMPALCESAVSPETTGGYNQTAQIGRLCSQANKTHLWIGVAKGTTQATAKTMLDGKSVYYALATPTTTEITNSELVGQLERLRHAHTYADTTNFSITATSPNLPAFLKVVAFGKDATPQGGYVWEDGGTGGATTITVDGVDNAQPIWTVVGPATNPSLTNITTGESIQWTGVVPNGQTLVVNMADMTASLSGANVFEFISGSWITLQAGNNRVSYSATAATGIATLEWNGVVG